MKPVCLQWQATSSLDAAEAVLMRYLPGLDVQLFPYQDGSVLLPPHVLRALEIEYGRRDARRILELAGLRQSQPGNWREIIVWAQANADIWSQRPGPLVQSMMGQADQPDWHITMCGVNDAWKTFGGVNRIDWGDLRIGQIDTGYTEHPVFGFPKAPWLQIGSARTFLPDDPPPGAGQDPLVGASGGHGTTSASLCCGLDPSTPYFGVAPRAPMVPARINDCVVIDSRAQEFQSAVHYLVDEAKVAVINVSMGTFLKLSPPRPIQKALDHCYERGVILIGAAGNLPVPRWPTYPAALPRAIAVAGVTREAWPWCGSSYGSWVDFSAPAKHVSRAQTAVGPHYGYTTVHGGTTFAAAMTSGAAALWLLRHRAHIATQYLQPWQRIEAFRHAARASVLKPDRWSVDNGFGAGILHVGKLMDPRWLPPAEQLTRR